MLVGDGGAPLGGKGGEEPHSDRKVVGDLGAPSLTGVQELMARLLDASALGWSAVIVQGASVTTFALG